MKPTSREEVAKDLERKFEEDDRNLDQIENELQKEQEKYDKWKQRNQARQEMLEEVVEMLDNIPELAESIADRQPDDKEKDWGNAVRKTKMELKGKYEKGVPPMKYHDKINSLKALKMGGRLANGEDVEEVF
jgi:DNA repair exonuclease SbcCD ATPase subunit